jgi:hypothetical protein
MPDLPRPSLVVSREALTAAATRLKKATTEKQLKTSRLAIHFEDGHLVLDIQDASNAAPHRASMRSLNGYRRRPLL